MKVRFMLVAAAATAALAMPTTAGAHGQCAGTEGGPDTSGDSLATPAGTIYYGSNEAGDGGYVAEGSDRGYIQADGDTRNGVRLHGSANREVLGETVNGSVAIGPDGVTDLCVFGEDVI